MKKEKGQTTVEFALVFAVAVILSIGALQSVYAFYLTRQVRAATEEAADVAAVHGGDIQAVQENLPAILADHRLDPIHVSVSVEPAHAGYLEPITVTLHYDVSVRLYGLFDLPIPAQQVRRLSEGG